MKILLFGASSQLGHELTQILPDLGNVRDLKHCDTDLTDTDALCRAIEAFEPEIIVNAAAYTTVDQAESQPDLAFAVNEKAVNVLARKAASRNIQLIHYSTDYVFDGTKTTPYTETDTPSPINTYGQSKLAGQRAITKNGCKHIIFPTSWISGRKGE